MAETDSEARHRVAERSIFYSSVGQGISFWALMEGVLVQIAAKLLGTSEQKTGLILYSIMNFYSWLTIIDDLFLIETKYADHKSEWGSLAAKLKPLNDIRVRLAHHTIFDGTEDDGKPRLKPNQFDARSKTKKHAPLTGREILVFTGNVIEVEKRLNALLAEMKVTDAQPVPFQETIPGPSSDPDHEEGSQ